MSSSDGCGFLSRNTAVYGSAASTASMFAYQSLRGLMRSFVGVSGASRSMSKVNFTSFDVNGWPSCHLTFRRRKNTRFRKLSCHDHFSASSPMIVSTLSVFFSGSKSTRLLKQGIAGQTVEIVDVSWIAKPCERSSRSIMLRTPPDFGVGAGGVWPAAGAIRENPTRRATKSAESGATCARGMRTSRKNLRFEVYVKTPHPTNRFHARRKTDRTRPLAGGKSEEAVPCAGARQRAARRFDVMQRQPS